MSERTDARHAAVELIKQETVAGLRRRWTALTVLHEEDSDALQATTVMALLEVVLEISATTCESLEELKSKRRLLGVFLAAYGSNLKDGDEGLRLLYERARRLAVGPR